MRVVHKLKWKKKKPVPFSSPALPRISNSLLLFCESCRKVWTLSQPSSPKLNIPKPLLGAPFLRTRVGAERTLLRRSLDTSRLEGPCLLCSIWRGRRGEPGPGLVAAGLPAGGEAAGAAISTPAPGRASAPPGPRGRIPSRTACCAGTEPRHGYGSAGPSCSPSDPMPVARALGEVPESKQHGGPLPAPDVISSHQSGHPF